MEKVGSNNSLLNAALKTWPALPYLGMGLWFAWSVMAFTGMVWISDVEVNGENISRLFLSSTLAYSLLCIIAAMANAKFTKLINSRAVMIAMGLVGALGALLIILSGPYYLALYMGTDAYVLFYTGGVLTGISTGFILLKCGQVYSKLPPKKVLIYCGLSQIIAVCLYFITVGAPAWSLNPGGPTLIAIIVFVALLPLAAATLSLEEKCVNTEKTSQNSKQAPERDTERRSGMKTEGSRELATSQQEELGYRMKDIPSAFWKFVLMLLLFSSVTNIIRALSVHISPIAETSGSAAINMLVRLAFALVIIVAALNRSMGEINFGKIFSFVALTIVIVIAMLPMINVLDSSLNLIIVCSMMIFGVIVFCLLVFICYQKKVPPVSVVGFGYGVYMLGSTFGWLIASYKPLDFIDVQFLPIFYLLAAGFILVLTFLMFSEKDFDRLFSAITSSETTLQSMLVAAEGEAREEQEKEEKRAPGRFITTLNDLAAECDLSPREADIFRYLAMGRGTDYIAETLSISWNTVRTHTQKVYTKLGVHSRSELMDLVDGLKK